VELAEVGETVTAREINHLAFIDVGLPSSGSLNLMLLDCLRRIWDLSERFMVRGAFQRSNKSIEVIALSDLRGTAWVQVTKVVVVLLVVVFLTIRTEAVVDNLEGHPVGFCLEQFVHMLLCSLLAVVHNPSVELNHPNLFDGDKLLSRGITSHLISNLSHVDVCSVALLLIALNDIVNVLAEVVSDRHIDQNVLEQVDHIVFTVGS